MPKLTKPCEQCGKEFTRYVRKDYKSRGHGRFCGRSCANKSRNPGRMHKCGNCGDEVYRSPSQVNPSGNIYCSHGCYAEGARRGWETAEGYVGISYTGHPLAGARGFVLEHWIVMYERNPNFAVWAKKNKWSIHHKNGRRNDNRDANLEWRAPGKHPRGWTVGDMVEVLELLGYEVKL